MSRTARHCRADSQTSALARWSALWRITPPACPSSSCFFFPFFALPGCPPLLFTLTEKGHVKKTSWLIDPFSRRIGRVNKTKQNHYRTEAGPFPCGRQCRRVVGWEGRRRTLSNRKPTGWPPAKCRDSCRLALAASFIVTEQEKKTGEEIEKVERERIPPPPGLGVPVSRSTGRLISPSVSLFHPPSAQIALHSF